MRTFSTLRQSVFESSRVILRKELYNGREVRRAVIPGFIPLGAHGISELPSKQSEDVANNTSFKQDDSTSFKQTSEPQITYNYPRGIELAQRSEDIHDEDWERAEALKVPLENARKGGVRRKEIELPQAGDPDDYRMSRCGRKVTSPWAHVKWHFRKLIFNLLNDLVRSNGVEGLPEPTVLQAALLGYALDNLDHLMFYEQYGEPSPSSFVKWSKLSEDAVTRAAAYAIEETLEYWNPEYIDEQRERGRRGGQASKRTGMWHDPENRQKLEKLLQARCTIKEIADQFKCSTSSIDRGIYYLKHPEKLSEQVPPPKGKARHRKEGQPRQSPRFE